MASAASSSTGMVRVAASAQAEKDRSARIQTIQAQPELLAFKEQQRLGAQDAAAGARDGGGAGGGRAAGGGAGAEALPATAAMLTSVEGNARELAISVDQLLAKLTGSMQQITHGSREYSRLYDGVVGSAESAVADSVLAMQELIAKCQELEMELMPVDGMTAQVKEVKEQLTTLEGLVATVAKQ